MKGDLSELQNLREALERAPSQTKENVLRPLGGEISVRFGQIATNRYMKDGPPPDQEGYYSDRPFSASGGPRKLTERLAQAYRGSFKQGSRESTTKVNLSAKGLTWQKVIQVPYAAMLEFGGSFNHTVPITDDARGYFYAKFEETGNTKWWRMFLASQNRTQFHVSGQIPSYPVAEPTAEDMQPYIAEKAEKMAGVVLSRL